MKATIAAICGLSALAAAAASGDGLTHHPGWVRSLAGSCAAVTAETLTLPMELVKVQMMLGKPLSAVKEAVDEQGFGSLFVGIEPGLLRQILYQGAKMQMYEPLRDLFIRFLGDSPAVLALAGGVAGGVSTTVFSPLWRPGWTLPPSVWSKMSLIASRRSTVSACIP